jgi:hypothetical protein
MVRRDVGSRLHVQEQPPQLPQRLSPLAEDVAVIQSRQQLEPRVITAAGVALIELQSHPQPQPQLKPRSQLQSQATAKSWSLETFEVENDIYSMDMEEFGGRNEDYQLLWGEQGDGDTEQGPGGQDV